MFACIYFEEDKSISVVGKADKDLKLDVEFESRSKCTMKWKVKGSHEKKTYHGTIVRINKVEDKTEKNATEKNKQDENNSILKYRTKPDLGLQFGDLSQTDEEESVDLTTTGHKVREASNIVEDIDMELPSISRRNLIPVPPVEVLEFFKSLNKPGVKRFIARFCEHFEETTDQEVHQCHQCYENIPSTYHELKAPGSDINKNDDFDVYRSHDNEQWDSDMNSSGTFLTYNGQEDYHHTNPQFNTSTRRPMQINQVPVPIVPLSVQNGSAKISPRKTPGVKVSHTVSQRTSPRKTPVKLSNTIFQRRISPRKTPDKNMMSTTPLVQQSPVQVSSVQPSSAHNSPLNKESLEEVKVKLFEKYEHSVKSDELRRITGRTKKEKNPGYYVVIKLMPLLFSTEGMANSRGQGIKPQKQGDTRSPLDSKKIQTIKAYSEVYCKKNQLKVASESEMNDAITEAVAYSRKKIEKQMKTK
ncbi:unnamed protein product [Mytilus coruscus]|uniref:BEN domain-containing protein n=1 Tax=Mytilus coruscus TaxID=42192 RepID=A0A6J8BME1_MYTCO|nr:unnamed protein product [Mytilus coruscus]